MKRTGNGRFLPIAPLLASLAAVLPACGGTSVGNPLVSIETALGLIDVSNAAATTVWGELPVANEEVLVQELSFELHRDPEKCSGANYSIRFNGVELTKDLEFDFEFSPPVAVSAGNRIRLGLDAIAEALDQAQQAGQLNNEDIGNFLNETVNGTATEVDDD